MIAAPGSDAPILEKRILVSGRSLRKNGDCLMVEVIFDEARRLAREVRANHARQIEIDRVHRVIHINRDGNVIGANEFDHRKCLVRWPIHIGSLSPFQFVIELIPIHI